MRCGLGSTSTWVSPLRVCSRQPCAMTTSRRASFSPSEAPSLSQEGAGGPLGSFQEDSLSKLSTFHSRLLQAEGSRFQPETAAWWGWGLGGVNSRDWLGISSTTRVSMSTVPKLVATGLSELLLPHPPQAEPSLRRSLPGPIQPGYYPLARRTALSGHALPGGGPGVCTRYEDEIHGK